MLIHGGSASTSGPLVCVSMRQVIPQLGEGQRGGACRDGAPPKSVQVRIQIHAEESMLPGRGLPPQANPLPFAAPFRSNSLMSSG
jgi:hypothetical protein